METNKVNIVRYTSGMELRFNKAWFEGSEAFTIEHNEWDHELIIRKHYLDVPRNAIRGSIQGNIMSLSAIPYPQLPLGEYAVDTEDSDEDTLVIPLY